MKKRAEDILAKPVQIYAQSILALDYSTRAVMPSEELTKRTLRNHKTKNIPGTTNSLEKLITEVNTYSVIKPSIKFTMEKEKENSLSFLDVQVTKNKKIMETTVYRKPTHTGRYLNFESNHSTSTTELDLLGISEKVCSMTRADSINSLNEFILSRVIFSLILTFKSPYTMSSCTYKSMFEIDNTINNNETNKINNLYK
ncbi:hypothetical protein RN001_004571 [Aquatica leii]|uniref:Uncharacterized protein n=1 Tax=Aquatica leii TaxID=1421715 RepID=A0AAN7SHI6_9COLE|nr:hypothetical protein RN001_004571 [Aquatica leii]